MCSVTSSPFVSSSSLALRPMVCFSTRKVIIMVTLTQRITETTPKSCIPRKEKPPPYARPPSTAKTPVRRVPAAPHMPWTPMAPTGSSILHTLSMNSMPNTTTKAAMSPIKNAPAGLTISQPAVIATRPAREPFNVMEMSGFL